MVTEVKRAAALPGAGGRENRMDRRELRGKKKCSIAIKVEVAMVMELYT